MTRARTLGAALLALPLLLILAVPALATGPADVAKSLRSDRVYVDPSITTAVDVGRVRSAAERAAVDVYVAILPQAAADSTPGGRTGINKAIGTRLGNDAVLITVIGRELTGGAGCGVGLDPRQADQVVRAGTGTAEASILSAINRLDDTTNNATLASACSGSDAGGGGSSTGTIVLVSLLGVGVVGGGTALAIRNNKRKREFDEQDRADVESLYDRLAGEVSTLDPGDDPIAKQALADAAERYSATGAAMADADTAGEWAAARRTAVEGLTAARLVRKQTGLDPGPEIPPPPGHGPQLTAAQTVQVGDQSYHGTPAYEPGNAHYYGGGTVGGQSVPGGWYPSRFWDGLIFGGILNGGFSGGHDRDDDRYDNDDTGHDSGHHGGGDWGSSSGGGGDWGGSSGGGGGKSGSW